MIRTRRAWVARIAQAARRLLPAAAAVLAASGVPAAATTLGVLMIPPVAFTKLLHDGIADYARTLPGVDVRFAFSPEGAGERQVEQVRAFIAAKVDALLVMPVEAAVNARIIRLAQEADIPLVYVNDGPREDWIAGRVAFVLPNELVAGRLQMRKLGALLDGKGRIAILSGHPTHSASVLRSQGVKEVIAEAPDLHVVAEAAANWDRREAAARVGGWLAAGIAIDAIAANNDEMALGAADAVEAAGLAPERILIGGVDATPDGLAALQRRRLAVTVYQDAALQGRRAVDDALKLIRNQPVQQYDWMPFELVTERMLTHHFSP